MLRSSYFLSGLGIGTHVEQHEVFVGGGYVAREQCVRLA